MFVYQGSLLDMGDPVVPDVLDQVQRFDLGDGAWLDWRPAWLPASDGWFDWAVETFPWRRSTRRMYDRIVDVPRSWCVFGDPYEAESSEQDPCPAILADLGRVLGCYYGGQAPRVAANWYQNGNDSVAWHSDNVPDLGDAIVAIVGVGERRRFLFRPKSGGSATSFMVGRGDLLVMGGTAQALFEHAVPKTASAAQRVSFMFRW
ncbi:MAG: alpha-ketoglutarate-dependent dioxygenase AlkB [Acidimicrobiales bacterium]